MQNCYNGLLSYTIKSGDTLYSLANRFNTTVDAIYNVNPGVNVNYLQIGQVINIPCVNNIMQPQFIKVNPNVLKLSNLMRLLWEQHIAWTRFVIMDIIYDLPERNYAVNRLLRNPKDFKEALVPLYGKEKAERFEKLLTEHLLIAADLVKAAKVNDEVKLEQENKRFYQNGDDIASFIASINPYWTFNKWQKMIYEHLDLVKQEAINFLNGAYEKNVNLYDKMEKQALGMADYMSEGILKQFPNNF